MNDQDIINTLLDKEIKKMQEPMWKKNLKATFYIALYLGIFPGIAIALFWTKHWILGTLWLIPTSLGLGVAFGGRKFGFWLASKVLKLRR